MTLLAELAPSTSFGVQHPFEPSLFESRSGTGNSGPYYEGTGCFHRQKVIYGLSPDHIDSLNGTQINYKDEIVKEFGGSKEFINSASQDLQGKTDCPTDLSNSLEAAYQVADCDYESNTNWGEKVGWLYGSKSEDVLTGLMIHKIGWRSCYLSSNLPVFLGCSPSGGGPASMTQQKRWVIGLLEILFSINNPMFATITGNLQFRQCLSYFRVFILGFRSIP
ncbi:hypothetical protein Q3G72_030790 [Acer saccharum]|nr:hypothetical protein Q3G72_030790 [Acer saccharum]